MGTAEPSPMVELEAIGKSYARRFLVQNRSFALREISLTVGRGQVVGILGESGSGKSTVANIVTGLTAFDAGRYRFKGRDIAGLTRRERFAFKSDVQIVFQDPYGCLNPRATVRSSIAESLMLHRPELDRGERRERVGDLLERVGLPASAGERYPHEFSGGQRQRIAIARAIAVEPELLVCDEPLSSLDVSIQAQILALLVRMITDGQLTLLFISHDVNVVRMLCERVYVMQDGAIVEHGPTQDVLRHPRNEYTARLLDAVY